MDFNILSFNIQMFKLLGLIPVKMEYNFAIQLLNAALIVVMCGTFIPCIHYFCANINDLTKTTEATYIIGAMSMSLFYYCFVINSKRELQELLEELQVIVHASESFSYENYCSLSSQNANFIRKIVRCNWAIPKCRQPHECLYHSFCENNDLHLYDLLCYSALCYIVLLLHR